ncbi:FRG domain-containing protein [Fibrobacter sp. UWCM]|uniref:FRG domain-containing protein n=1 Tax=Fibrobacter sp. UWCM TaxID=1896208 RepID=UPI0009200D37|nr:FRG domain-containing protein [Fibrobacter sp. UWCM]SHG79852.1 FRG domain-containing protein [Fibrobacter sp. UWCM]
MKLVDYKSLEEKGEIFKSSGYLRIDTVASFCDWFDAFPKEDVLFRGVKEAKYKIYTSAQRLYITHDLALSGRTVEDVIAETLEQAKQVDNGILKKYFSLLDVIDHDMLYLSFLQHYSGISPLIDFTTSIEKALFFMQEGVTFSDVGEDGIDNYCSLYYKLQSPVTRKLRDLSETDAREIFSFSEMHQNARSVVFQSEQIDISSQKKCSFANLNLVAQDGRFLFYSDGINPLEENISCVDIHKSLAPYIKKRLEEKGITKESIYPQEETIAKMALQRALENI